MIPIETIIATLVVVTFTVLIFLIWYLTRRQLKNTMSRQAQFEEQMLSQVNHLQQQLKKSIKQQAETSSSLETSLTAVQSQVKALASQQEDLQGKLREYEGNDPEIKLYQHAKKLVASGASVDEIVDACGIPKAEVEMLLAMKGG